VGALYHKLYTQSSAPKDGQNNCPKHVELIEITHKPLLLHLVGYVYLFMSMMRCQANIKRNGVFLTGDRSWLRS